ncbi:hypothetical protein [Gilliamella sp. BG6]|uniref:hypothetical protein n=1 Tax=unclassified Gilliamella TaxID=2685620 RepID=UPI003987BD9C
MNNNFLFNRFLQLTRLYKNYDLVGEIFELGDFGYVNKNQINRWSKINPQTSNYQEFPDCAFAAFIRGLLSYVRIKQSQGVDVFNFDNDFTESIITMFFNYRDDKACKGVKVFNFDI